VAQDSSRPDFWETRYRDHVTPWDAGDVPQALRKHVGQLPPGTRVLIPGCGSAYEAGWLADQGFDVLAIDFSPAAVSRARQVLGPKAGLVREADFFDFEFGAAFDVIYERAFLCALPPRIGSRYPGRCAQLLKPGGVIAGFFFFAETPRGPPFGTTPEALDSLLTPNFQKIADEPVTGSIEVFRGKERWQVWQAQSP
jgi:SAM-dependent methyltransferase